MRNQHKSSSPYPEWNNKKFEAKLEREIEQRKNLISISANYILPDKENALGYHSDNLNDEILESTGIYKQFLLIGVPPSVENSRDPNVKPTVLIAYPPFEYPNMPIKKIIDHCMPTGPSREFLSTNSLTPIQDEFVFQFGGGLGSDGKPIYGVCVHVSTKDTSLPFYGSKNDKDRIFCFCLMTKMPIFSVHFAFLTSLVLWTIGHVRHLHKYENKIRVNIPPGEPIDDLDLEDQIGHHPSVEVPVSFQNEIASYFISNISSKPEMLSRASNTFMQGYVSRKLEKMNNKRHNFHYETEDCSIELRFPPIKDISENCIEWASLDTLFSLLSAEDILMIISGLLLDRQVLIIGSRLEEVSMTVWALKSILRPFKFAGTVIPILPTTSEDYIGLLQLPTPFLFGVPRCNELKVIKFLETAVFVDLDKRNVPPIEDLPDYPNENYVRSKLNKFIGSIKSKKESNEFGLPAIYKKTLNHKYIFSTASCQKINEIIGSPFENSIYSNYICGFFVSAEGVTVFNEELFLGQIFSMLTSGPEELYGETNSYPIREKDKEKKINEEFEFWSNIVESQTFQMYIEERMQSFMELKNRAINGNDLIENEENKKDEKNEEDDIQKIAQLSEEINVSDNNEDIKDIDKNKSGLSKRKTLYNFDQIEHLSSNHGKNEAEVPRSSPPRISINRKKIQMKNPQRIKSLKNVLDDLPTPCSSNNKLLDLNEDRVKSDADVSIEDNENIKLPNKKIRKSSTLAAINRSDFFLEEEEDEVKKEDKKSTSKKSKNLNKKADDDEPEKVNNDKNQKNKQNKQQQKQRKSSNTSDHDEQNNENSDEEAAKKLKKSNSNDNKQTKKNLNNNKNENKNNNSDDEEITKKQKKSNDAKKVTSKSQQVRRSPLVNQTDSSSEEEEMTKKRRKSIPKDNKQETANQVKRTSSNDKVDDKNKKVDEEDASKKHRKSDAKKVTSRSQKPTRTRLVKSDEQNSSDDEETTKKRRKSSSNENKQTTSKQAKKASSNDKVDEENIKSDEEDASKKNRKSDAKKVTSRSQKPTRNQLVKSDEQNSSDDEEIVKKQRKSSEAKRTTSRSQKPTRTALINNDDDQESDEKITNRRRKSSEVKQTTSRSQKPTRTALNKEDSLDEEIENELSKKRRKSSDVKHTTRHTRKSSSTNDDDENDNKKHRRSSTSSRSSKPTRKSSNTNESDSSEDDEELMKERNVKLRKSNSNDKTKQTRKSSNDNDEDENTKEKKHRKSVSNSKSKPVRKSSNNDDDDDDENIKKRNLKHRKSVSNDRFKLARKSSNNDDDDDDNDNELKNQKLRRKSAQSKSTHNFNEKVHRKSNEDNNIRTKSTKNQDPANKKTLNPIKNVINKPRSKSIMNKPDRKNDNDSNKKKAQLQFNSSSDSETYSSDSINPNLFEMDRSSESYDD